MFRRGNAPSRITRGFVMADVVMPKMPPSTPCRFESGWKGKCGKPTDNGLCSEHEGMKCIVCDKQATQTCDYTGSSPFVCGAPLCDTCRHEPYHPKDAPYPSKHLNAADFAKALEKAKEAV